MPDLRGRGQSEQPLAVADYALTNMVADVTELLDSLGIASAHVVGHDWGAAVAWVTASISPDRVRKLVAISVGFPGAAGPPDLESMQKRWYQILIQFPAAEELLQREDWYLFRLLLEGEDVDPYIETLSRPGALTAALNWYRANLPLDRILASPPPLPPVAAATLGIWSTGDVALTERSMTASESKVSGSWRYERIEGVSHWIPLQAPDRLNQLLISFLGS